MQTSGCLCTSTGEVYEFQYEAREFMFKTTKIVQPMTTTVSQINAHNTKNVPVNAGKPM